MADYMIAIGPLVALLLLWGGLMAWVKFNTLQLGP